METSEYHGALLNIGICMRFEGIVFLFVSLLDVPFLLKPGEWKLAYHVTFTPSSYKKIALDFLK